MSKNKKEKDNTKKRKEFSVSLIRFQLDNYNLVTFIFKVFTLIFFVLAEYELKKMWSKFDNVTPA